MATEKKQGAGPIRRIFDAIERRLNPEPYRIPKEIDACIPEHFYAALAAEYCGVCELSAFTRYHRFLSVGAGPESKPVHDRNSSWFDVDTWGCWWWRAFEAACRKLGMDWLVWYRNSLLARDDGLVWFDSFDEIVSAGVSAFLDDGSDAHERYREFLSRTAARVPGGGEPIPDDVEAAIPGYFYPAMFGELCGVMGVERLFEYFQIAFEDEDGDGFRDRAKHDASAPPPKIDAPTEGWDLAFAAACAKLGMGWLVAYRESLGAEEALSFEKTIREKIAEKFAKQGPWGYFRHLVDGGEDAIRRFPFVGA